MQTLGSAIKYAQSTFANRPSKTKIAGNTILASAIAYKNGTIDHSKDNGWMSYDVHRGMMMMMMMMTATFGRRKVN